MRFENLDPKDKVNAWLATEGYSVENAVVRKLRECGAFQVAPGENYFDRDEQQIKEIDIAADFAVEARSTVLANRRLLDQLKGDHDVSRVKRWESSKLLVALRIECKYAPNPWVLFSDAQQPLVMDKAGRPLVTSFGAKLALFQPREDAAGSIPLIDREVPEGYALKVSKDPQKGGNREREDSFKAIMSSMQSANSAVCQRADEDLVMSHTSKVAFPIIVIKGALFNVHRAGDLSTEVTQIKHGRICYMTPGDPNKSDRYVVINVFTLDYLDDFIVDAVSSCKEIERRYLSDVKAEVGKIANDSKWRS